ncbi:hypothetical protein ACPV3O_21455 [Vibrio rotiferianus]
MAVSTLLGGYVAVLDIWGGDGTVSTQSTATQHSEESKPFSPLG